MMPSTGKPSILCLEDEDSFQKLYGELFADDYNVIPAKTLHEAQRILDTADVRLAIVDLRLLDKDANDISGFMFLERLQTLGLISNVPTVIVSALGDPDYVRRAFKDFDVKDYFWKQRLDANGLSDLKSKVDVAVMSTYAERMLGETPRVLVVEDNEDWAALLKEILESEGCQVDVARNYQDANELIKSRVYHLATLDIRLSDKDAKDSGGYNLLDTAKRIGSIVDSIVISAHATTDPTIEQTIRALTDLGARDVILKSKFTEFHFRRRVRKLLARLVYITVTIGGDSENPVLRYGREQELVVAVQGTRPDKGVCRSIARPSLARRFELQVDVHPFDVNVKPGSSQVMTVIGNDSAEPLVFSLTPIKEGSVEIVVDIGHQKRQLGRIVLTAEAQR